MSKTATSTGLRAAALRFVADRAVQYLLQIGEPAKTGQITGFVSEEYPVSGKVVRDALTLDTRFVQRERRWDLAARDVDARRPMERTIEEFLDGLGRPLRIETLGIEIAKATGAVPEVCTDMVRRLVTTRARFLIVGDERVLPTAWLLDIQPGSDVDDVLFANFDDEAEVENVRSKVKPAEWKTPESAAEHAIDKAGEPLSGRAMAFLTYELAPGTFSPARFYDALVNASLTPLSDSTWLSPTLVAALPAIWDRIADEPPVAGAPEEAARPSGEIAITPSDMEEIAVVLRRAEGFITSRQILEQVMEVNAGDRDYEKWEAVLASELQERGEVISVGWDRWRRFETIPTGILDAPDTLEFGVFSFQTLEGEELGVELTEDGLEGNLKELVKQPLAAMGGECKPQKDRSAECTVTCLHHASGTLPIGGANPYFPTDPPLLEATLIVPNGRIPLWINNQLGLAFGLESVYEALPMSGAAFTLRPATRPGDYKLEISPNSDPLVGIDEGRMKELHAIAARPTFNDISTFDLVGEFLERHRKGADYHTLLAEMWIIRPVSPQLVASLLSEYYCFKQNKNGSWSFDAREVDKGFKKAKRKYVK